MNTIASRKMNSQLTVHGVVLDSESSTACGEPNLLLKLKVKRAFGSPAQEGDTVTVATSPSSASCGVQFQSGTEVVVFANAHSSCRQPAGLMWTYLMNGDVEEPTQAQIDSLYGRPLGVMAGSPRVTLGSGNLAMGGRIERTGNGVAVRNGMAGERRRADGRALTASPVSGQ